jgi:hypothetical protein
MTPLGWTTLEGPPGVTGEGVAGPTLFGAWPWTFAMSAAALKPMATVLAGVFCAGGFASAAGSAGAGSGTFGALAISCVPGFFWRAAAGAAAAGAGPADAGDTPDGVGDGLTDAWRRASSTTC